MQLTYKGIMIDLTWEEQQALDIELGKLLEDQNSMDYPITTMIFRSL